MSRPVEPMLSEIVLERHGRVLVTYDLSRDPYGGWILVDRDANPAATPAEGLRPDRERRATGWER
ncbi:hypothetical protein [Plantactinospora sp. CA-290183]|uniref:hypothetical protein n=1 Tax=Plantactinospora sp. CA-290183 TaxID=3240006 RepID=UPI003D8B9923